MPQDGGFVNVCRNSTVVREVGDQGTNERKLQGSDGGGRQRQEAFKARVYDDFDGEGRLIGGGVQPPLSTEFVVDTGFEGFLTLPPAAVATLQLPFIRTLV